MIPQPSLGSYLKGLIAYNEDKVGEGAAELLYVNSLDGELSTFEAQYRYLVAEKLDQKNLLHLSLNFPAEDRPALTRDMYIQVARDFLEAYGFPADHPFAMYRHDDKNHPHVHIATPLILETGKAIDDSFMVKRMIRIARRLEEKHALTKVHRKGPKIAAGPSMIGQDHNFEKANEAIERALTGALARKPTSFKELDKYLRRPNLRYNQQACALAYELSKQGNGITFFLQSVGQEGGEQTQPKQLCRGIKGSKIAGSSFSALQRSFETNKALAASHKPRVRSLMASALAALPKDSTLPDFRQKLAATGIETNLYHTRTGEIFGMDFKDQVSGITYAGSDLDKNYSWNVLKKVLKVPVDSPEVHEISTLETSGSRPMSIIADLKSKIPLTYLVEQQGYFKNEDESTSQYDYFENGASKIRIYDHGPDGLYYVDCHDPSDKGDIVNFVINKELVQGLAGLTQKEKNSAAIKYLLKVRPDASRPLPPKETASKKHKEGSFQPIAVYPPTEENYLVAKRSIPLSILESDFKGTAFSSPRIELPVGDGDAKLLIPRHSAVFPLKHFDTGEPIGQMIRNDNLRAIKKDSDKIYGIWDSHPQLPVNIITTLEDAIDAISHRVLFPDHQGKYLATMGNPSQKVVQYISSLIIDPHKTVILAGDNDLGGQRQNLLYLLNAHASTAGIKISVSIAKDKSTYNLKLFCPDVPTRDQEYALFDMVAGRVGRKDVVLEVEALNIKARFRHDKDFLFMLVQALIEIFKMLKTLAIRPKNKDYNDDLKEVMSMKHIRDVRHRSGPKL